MIHDCRRFSILEQLEPRLPLTATVVGSPLLANEASVGSQHDFAGADAVAVLDGGAVAVYSGRGAGDRDGVFLRRFDAQGAAIALPQLVNQTVAGLQANSTVSATPAGGFVIAWAGRGTGDREGIFARWYDATGTPLTGEVLVNQTAGGRQENPHVAVAADGSATFVWHGVGTGDFDGVFARRFSAAGVALGDELLVNTTTARAQAFADIALAADNSALVTWSSRHQDGSDWGVYAQRLAADGTKVGSEFLVNTATTGSQTSAQVAALDAGFAVAWQSRGQDGDGWGVFGQKLSAAGAAIGAEFRLNSETAGNQQEVALASTGAAGVLATWTAGQPDGAGWNVAAREVDLASATPTFGTEFSVHPATATANFGHQRAPSVAVRATQAIIAWTGDGTLDHDGVYLQRFRLSTSAANVAPNLAPIPTQFGAVDVTLLVTVTATDLDAGDSLTFLLDVDDSPAGATIEKTSNGQAVIRWTPRASDLPGPVRFRVLVADDGNPSLIDAEEFLVTFSNLS